MYFNRLPVPSANCNTVYNHMAGTVGCAAESQSALTNQVFNHTTKHHKLPLTLITFTIITAII